MLPVCSTNEESHIDLSTGVSGFFLDFALLHHDRQGRFVLAVETDGDRHHRSERPAIETVSARNTWNGSAGSFTDLVQ